MLQENKNFTPRTRRELTSIQIDHLLSIFNALSKSTSQKEFMEALEKTSKLALTVQSYCKLQEHSQDTLRKLSEIQENLTLLSKRVKQTDFNAKL